MCYQEKRKWKKCLKRNEAFFKSKKAKLKEDPTMSMRHLASVFSVDEITIRRQFMMIFALRAKSALQDIFSQTG